MQRGVDVQRDRMYKGRGSRFGQVAGDQQAAQSKDEARHQDVINQVGGLYSDTKADVDRILAALPGKVNTLFESGAATASRNLDQYWWFPSLRGEPYRYSRANWEAFWAACQIAVEMLHAADLLYPTQVTFGCWMRYDSAIQDVTHVDDPPLVLDFPWNPLLTGSGRPQ